MENTYTISYAIPLVSLILLIGIALFYFKKRSTMYKENIFFEYILIISIIYSVINTTLHLVGSTIPISYQIENYQINLVIVNKILFTLITSVPVALFLYLITISIKNDVKKIYKNVGIVFLCQIIIMNILPLEFYELNGILNVKGLGFIAVIIFITIWLLCSLILMVKSKNNKDKRYNSFKFFLVGIILIAIISYIFPYFIIYDFTLYILVFIMYNTIENPDLKMIEQLDAAKLQAEKANRAKTDFLSSMSHEIRTPLNAIVGFSESMKEEDLSKDGKEDVENIITASNNLLEIINGILDITKIEANKLEIVNVEYKPKKIIKDVAALVNTRIKEKPITFNIKVSEDLPDILYGDYVRLKQIIVNLLTNAAKYTREGYINFNVSTVKINGMCRLIITVEDSGIGIKEENIDKLFSNFERFDLEKNATIEGTGLGLAITKKLIELMNGKVVVKSVYGEGSSFIVAIDQKIVVEEAIEELTIEEKIEFNNQKILIVDDNKINLKVVERLLRGEKVILETIDNGFSCLEKIQNGEKFDLILMDDMMPKMSGVETMKKLHQLEGFNTPIIVLTANALAGMKKKYLEDGFDDYLPKPIEKDLLKKTIKKNFKT